MEDMLGQLQENGEVLHKDLAHARSDMCCTVEAIHTNASALLDFFSAHGLQTPTEVSNIIAKMTLQVAPGDGPDGFGTPPAAQRLASVLSSGKAPMPSSIAKVQDWQSNPSMLDSLSPGVQPFVLMHRPRQVDVGAGLSFS